MPSRFPDTSRIARRFVTGLVLFVAVCWLPASAQDRTWSATGRGTDIAVTDCRDCGDDIGMMISCKGLGQPAEVLVHWAAQRDGVEGAPAPLTIQIDGTTFRYAARTMRMEQIGYPPAFSLAPGDPLIAALQAGRQATVRFGDSATHISLGGARKALDTFKTHCGWSRAGKVPGAQPPPPPGRRGGTGPLAATATLELKK
jgi:hypothetical protein